MATAAEYKDRIIATVRSEVPAGRISTLWSDSQDEFPGASTATLFHATMVAAIEIAIGSLDAKLGNPQELDDAALKRLQQRSSDLWRLHASHKSSLNGVLTSGTTQGAPPQIGTLTRNNGIEPACGRPNMSDPRYYT
jgi:hypothetical protein